MFLSFKFVTKRVGIWNLGLLAWRTTVEESDSEINLMHLYPVIFTLTNIFYFFFFFFFLVQVYRWKYSNKKLSYTWITTPRAKLSKDTILLRHWPWLINKAKKKLLYWSNPPDPKKTPDPKHFKKKKKRGGGKERKKEKEKKEKKTLKIAIQSPLKRHAVLLRKRKRKHDNWTMQLDGSWPSSLAVTE